MGKLRGLQENRGKANSSNINPYQADYALKVNEIRSHYASIVTGIIANDNYSIEEIKDALRMRKDDFKNLVGLGYQYIDKIDIDPETGLYNRRRWSQKIQALSQTFKQSKKPFSMAIIDLDFFKKINDTKGHSTGDYVLSIFSKELRNFLQPGLFNVYRIGGEEFSIIYKGPSDKLQEKLNEFKQYFSQINLERRDGEEPMYVTFSAGVTEYRGGKEEELYDFADDLLYEAKTSGRDLVIAGSYIKTNEEMQLSLPLVSLNVIKKYRAKITKILNLYAKAMELTDKEELIKIIEEIDEVFDEIVRFEKEFEYMEMDDLTKLKNRYVFNKDISGLIENVEKTDTPFSLSMLDLDYFKSINDKYGHKVGDEVIKTFTHELSLFLSSKEGFSELYRVGGEEFAILSNLSKEDLGKVIEEFREYMSQKLVYANSDEGKKKVGLHITFSAGVTEYEKTGNYWEGFKRVCNRADDFLYKAKEVRNSTIIG